MFIFFIASKAGQPAGGGRKRREFAGGWLLEGGEGVVIVVVGVMEGSEWSVAREHKMSDCNGPLRRDWI
jgi:hypothetical protein